VLVVHALLASRITRHLRAGPLRVDASPWHGLERWKHAPAEVSAQI